MQPSRSTQVQPQPSAHRRRSVAIVAAVAAIALVVAAIAIIASPPRTHLVTIDKTGVSGATVLVMNFNVSIQTAGPIPYEGLHLLVDSLSNGSIYSEAVYMYMEPINASTYLWWHVGVSVSPWALTSADFSYYFLLSVSGTQVDSRTVT